ncbi:MAG: glycosyltransferase family 2 protein [Dehalococcoidia bacterium]
MTAYILLLVFAGATVRGKRPAPAQRKRRFAVVVPAHNEEAGIARTLDSLLRLSYPRPSFDVHVIADNCDDRTADVARRYTSFVHERVDETARGKGQALRWLFDRLPGDGYDAFAVVDADSVVCPDFLSEMNDRLESGCLAVQGYDGVLNPEESWVSSLRAVAFCLLHHSRRRGMSALGASAGLAGDGMVFAAELREAREWDAFGLTEDLELHSKLAMAGVKVAFAPGASVFSDMPTSLATARDQNLRWERGRLAVARVYAPKLLVAGLRSRDWPKLAAALDLMVPPLSVHALLAVAFLGLSVVVASTAAVSLAAATLLGLAVYVVVGLAAAKAPLRLWLALGFAPFFALWKGWLYGQALLARKSPSWIRTRRPSEASQDR